MPKLKRETPERKNVLSIRLTPEEGEGMVRAAARAGRGVTEWLREVARTAVVDSDAAAEET